MPFEQSRIFYLSVDQEESILLLFPDALMNTKRNIISKRNKRPIAVWRWKLTRTRISRYWNKDSVGCKILKGIIRNDDSCGDYLHQYEWTLQSGGRNWNTPAL
jgi:hypothetical protein